jgi:hypothetical protein
MLGMLLGLAAATAQAASITLTLDNPNGVFARPSTGSIDYDFTGTLSIPTGFFFTQATIEAAYDTPVPSAPDIIANGPPPTGYGAANNGGVINGVLVVSSVRSDNNLALYNISPSGAPLPQFTIDCDFHRATIGASFGGTTDAARRDCRLPLRSERMRQRRRLGFSARRSAGASERSQGAQPGSD